MNFLQKKRENISTVVGNFSHKISSTCIKLGGKDIRSDLVQNRLPRQVYHPTSCKNRVTRLVLAAV